MDNLEVGIFEHSKNQELYVKAYVLETGVDIKKLPPRYRRMGNIFAYKSRNSEFFQLFILENADEYGCVGQFREVSSRLACLARNSLGLVPILKFTDFKAKKACQPRPL